MSRRNAQLHNQTVLPFDSFFAKLNGDIIRSSPTTATRPSLPLADSGRNERDGRLLADRRRSSVNRIRDEERAPWFIDDIEQAEPDPDPDTAA